MAEPKGMINWYIFRVNLAFSATANDRGNVAALDDVANAVNGAGNIVNKCLYGFVRPIIKYINGNTIKPCNNCPIVAVAKYIPINIYYIKICPIVIHANIIQCYIRCLYVLIVCHKSTFIHKYTHLSLKHIKLHTITH